MDEAQEKSIAALREKISDQWWRLNNLYKIRDKYGQVVPFKPNWAQRDLYYNRWYFNVILKARQLGMSTFILIYLLDSCLFEENHAAGVIAHTREDSEELFKNKVRFAYDGLPEWLKNTFRATQDTSRKLEFSNGSSITVGTSLRSGTYQKLHISEYGKIAARYPEKAKEIKTGALNTVQVGQQIFVESTAEGNTGEFYDLCKRAMDLEAQGSKLTALDPKLHFYPWYRDDGYVLEGADISITPQDADYFDSIDSIIKKQTPEGDEPRLLTPQQKAWYVKKAEQQGDEMKREFPSTPEESFEQSMEGAYYTKQMMRVRKDGGIGRFPHIPNKPVYTFWDLGMNDMMSIWFMQHIENAFYFIDYLEDYGEPLQFYINEMTKKGYTYKEHFWPHDGTIRDLSTGKTRRETAIGLGLYPLTIVKRTKSVNDDIQAVRNILPLCKFDEEKCKIGINHLDNYRKEWDDKLGTWKDKPRHDDASHGADSFRMFATGYKDRRGDFMETTWGDQAPQYAEDYDYDLFSV